MINHKFNCYKVTLDHNRIKIIWAKDTSNLLYICARDYPEASVDFIEQIS